MKPRTQFLGSEQREDSWPTVHAAESRMKSGDAGQGIDLQVAGISVVLCGYQRVGSACPTFSTSHD